MKKVFFLLVLLAATLGSQAQDSTRHYASFFGKNATEWTTGWSTADFGHLNLPIMEYGDTIINEHTYKRVVLKNTSDYGDDRFDTFNNVVWMREDTLTGRLWIRQFVLPDRYLSFDTQCIEYVVCNMGMEVGDSLNMIEIYDGEIDSSLYTVIRAEEYQGLRKLVLRNNHNNNLSFYEGAGHTRMFFSIQSGMEFFNDVMGTGDYLLGCVHKDDTVAFSNPEIDSRELIDCKFQAIFGSVDETEEPLAVTLYPNPCGEQLQIENLPEGVQSLYITDMLGRRVYSTTQPGASINTATLPQGTYRLTLVLPNNRQHTLTFVKR